MIGTIVKVRVEKQTYVPAIVISEGSKGVFALQVFGSLRYAGFRPCVLRGIKIGQFNDLNAAESDDLGESEKYRKSTAEPEPRVVPALKKEPEPAPKVTTEPPDAGSEGAKDKTAD